MIPLKSILVLLVPLKALACGLDWSPPVSHFENVDYQGNVHIVRKLGEVEKLPIYLIFNSTNGVSPYVGSGFEIPLLESRIWQVDENRFQMKSPSGWLWVFQRTKDPNVLEGNAGWKGLIKDDTFTVWAPCGDKISFKRGRIVSMQIKDDKFDYAYRDNRVESVQQNGQEILRVRVDSTSSEVVGIELPKSRQEVTWKRGRVYPRIETVGTSQVISQLDDTLTSFQGTSQRIETFDFSVDDQKRTLILNIQNRPITWNCDTKRIISDDDWTYEIRAGKDRFANAAIGRTNGEERSEFWHRDETQGEETTSDADGTKTVSRWFTSGVLAGQPRSFTQKQRDEKSKPYPDGFTARQLENSGAAFLQIHGFYNETGNCNRVSVKTNRFDEKPISIDFYPESTQTSKTTLRQLPTVTFISANKVVTYSIPSKKLVFLTPEGNNSFFSSR